MKEKDKVKKDDKSLKDIPIKEEKDDIVKTYDLTEKEVKDEEKKEIRVKIEKNKNDEVIEPINNIVSLIGKDYTEYEVSDKLIKRKSDVFVAEEDTNIGSGQWAVNGQTYWPCSDSVKHLPPGIYSIDLSMSGQIFFTQHKVISDEIIRLPDEASDEVLSHIEQFKTLKDKFRELGFIYKRGILLWGPQGSGKTCTVVQVMRSFIKDGGVAILGNYPRYDSIGLKQFREIEPDKPITVIYEDVDDIIRCYGDRSLTKLLDGEDNVENVLFLATTNYPERLPPRLLNRPSRFDVVKHIGLPSEDARFVYLKAKTDLSLAELKTWARKTDNLSIPHLKELIILVKIYEKDLDEGISILKGMSKMTPNSNVYYNREIKRDEYNIELTVEQPNIEVITPSPNIEIKPPKVEVAAPVVNVNLTGSQRIKKVVTKRDAQGRVEEVEDILIDEEEK